MTDQPLQRIDYVNPDTGIDRTGQVNVVDARVDVEQFLLPYGQHAVASLHQWGIANGLAVAATNGQAGLMISPGAAVDSQGRLIALIVNGLAVVRRDVGQTQVRRTDTINVTAAGVPVDTTQFPASTYYLTISYQEAADSSPGTTPHLYHAPWLRLVDTGIFVSTGEQVVLGRITLGDKGIVVSLDTDGRRFTGVTAQRIEMHRPVTSTATGAGSALSVTDVSSVQLVADAAGSLDVNVVGSDGTTRAVSIDNTGSLSLGLNGAAAQRPVHVEGPLNAPHPAAEIHSGGAGGGFSFADRSHGGFVEHGTGGQRWVWYGLQGKARLWSNDSDQLVIGIPASPNHAGLDVQHRMRVSKGNSASAGIWFDQGGSEFGEAFVGLLNENTLGFFGIGSGWSMTMDTHSGDINMTGDLAVQKSLTVGKGPGLFQGFFVNQGDGAMLTVGPVQGQKLAAGFFGDVQVGGSLSKAGGNFRIDHPLDPENRYLSHSFVESPDMLNIYRGTVTTDGCGEATVQLPDYFNALNDDFCYQLTPIGALTDVAVAEGVDDDNRFTVRTARPNTTVCWQVSGVRKDPWAQAHPIIVEELKSGDDQGRLLHPQEYADANHTGAQRVHTN